MSKDNTTDTTGNTGNTGDTGLTRRSFIKAAGLGGAAMAALGAPVAALAAQEPAQAPGGAPAKAPAGAIPKRPLGKTGVEVSTLCLGGMFDTINNQLLLKQALAWGVTYWDTAEAYGNGLSEEGFGRFFSRNPEARKQVFLVTKLVPKGGNFTERLDKALQRLQTPQVDLFFVHGISGIEEMTPELKTWAAEMKKAGKIKFFGFSTHANMEACLQGAAKLDWIDAVMISYNFRLMHTPQMQEAIDACHKAGVGLVAMKSQGGGSVKTDSPAELDMAGRFLEKGFTDKQAKMKAVWENPKIASICSQMHTLTILSANVAAARDMTALAAGDVESLARFAEETGHGYCAGCADVCGAELSENVAINDVMRSLMYLREYGEPELARQTFASLPEDIRARLGEIDFSRAEKACPQRLAIADLMREASELLA